MATRLYEVLSFVNIAAGAQATLPHHINVNGVAQVPDFLYPDTGGFVLVAADATGVTMQNNNAGVASLDLALFFIYSPERLFGQVLSHLTPQPFFVSGGAAAAPGSNLWAPGTGVGSVIQNNGSGNLASGIDSLAEGGSNVETVLDNVPAFEPATNHLEGIGNTITVQSPGGGGVNHVEGYQNSLSATGAAVSCDFNHVEGNQNQLSAVVVGGCEFNHVEGNQNHLTLASGTGALSFNHIEGNRNHLLVNGGDLEFSHIEGSGHTVTSTTNDANFSHVEGDSHVVTDADTSHVEGFANTVNVKGGTVNHIEGRSHVVGTGAHVINYVHVEGRLNTVSAAIDAGADAAHVEGQHCVASAPSTHAQGDSASATRETQFSFASGKFGVAGDAQGGVLVLRGSTPGAAPGEAVELKFGSAADQVIQLEDGKGYTLTITAVAKDTVAGGKGVQSFMQRYSVRRAAGLTVIAAPGASDQFGDVACDTWTLVASVGAAPDRFVLTFTTTGAQAAARCGAKVEIVEVLNA